MLDAFESFSRDKEEDEIRQWRYATSAARGRAIAQLMDFAEAIVKGRGFGESREDLVPIRRQFKP